MMIWRKALTTASVVLLLTGTAFAFPHDPKPGSIDEKGGYGEGSAAFKGFAGDWTNTLRATPRASLLVIDYMHKMFLSEGGGPGGKKDMKIWTTPAFSDPVKMKNDKDSWNHLLANPGQDVPVSVGLSMITTHKEMVDFIQQLPKTNMTIEYLGEIPRGFPFPMLVFSTSKDRSPEGLKATGKPLVWIQGNVHGGEWSGGEAALAMAEQLAKGAHDEVLKKINVVIVPRINADGAKRPVRTTYDTLALQWTAVPEPRDLNRDHMLLDHPVTRAMKKMLALYEPHFSIDLHERGSTRISSGTDQDTVERRFGRVLDTDAGDLGSAGATSQQLPRDFIALRYNELDPALAKMAEKYGIWFGLYREVFCPYAQGNQSSFSTDWMSPWEKTSWVPEHPDNVPAFNGLTKGPFADAGMPANQANDRFGVVTSTAFDADAPYFVIQEAQYNPRNARNNNGMAGAISQLYENKSGGATGNRGMFERRVAASYVAILATMVDAAERADFWMKTLEGMRTQWIAKGKTVSEDDMVPILPLVSKPSFWGQPNEKVGYKGHDLPWMVVDITDAAPTGKAPVTPSDIAKVKAYDSTKAMKRLPADKAGTGVGKGNNYEFVTDESGSRDYQIFKFVYAWQGPALRERVRPYAYLIDGPYASEAATRMALNGIEVKRLAQDTEIEVQAHKYNQQVYINNAASDSTGWRNRDVTLYTTKKLFKKDETYVVYLAQVRTHQITTYFEPDMPYAALPCMYLPYMSVALGGPGNGYLHENLTGKEMPSYRYLKTVDLPTYNMDMSLPLINRGAVARFFDFPTAETVKGIAAKVREKNIRVYNYDIQIHARTDSLVNGKFELTLPTNADTKGYMIRKKDGTYEKLSPTSTMLGMNVAPVVIANQTSAPFTVDMDRDNRPLLGGGPRMLVHALPPQDDLVGVQVIEIIK